MPDFRKALLPALAVLVRALSWRLLNDKGAGPQELGGEEARSDYYVAGARLTQTDLQGRLEYTITAARMLHRPDLDSWLLEAPAMTLFTEAGEPWYGRAERGRVWAGGDEAELLGDVRLWREGSALNRPVTIDTRDVHVQPPRKYAETAAPVAVRQQLSRLDGIGARIYLDQDRYELLSEVRGHYVPTPN